MRSGRAIHIPGGINCTPEPHTLSVIGVPPDSGRSAARERACSEVGVLSVMRSALRVDPAAMSSSTWDAMKDYIAAAEVAGEVVEILTTCLAGSSVRAS